jgi:hypothetical protein
MLVLVMAGKVGLKMLERIANMMVRVIFNMNYGVMTVIAETSCE